MLSLKQKSQSLAYSIPNFSAYLDPIWSGNNTAIGVRELAFDSRADGL